MRPPSWRAHSARVVNGIFSVTITSSSFVSALRQALARDPIERLVQRPPEPVEEFVDFDNADDKRRRQRQHVADHRANKQAFLLGEMHGAGADAMLGLERTLAGLVGDEFHAADQAEAARLADERMLAERLEPGLEQRGVLGGFVEDRSRA